MAQSKRAAKTRGNTEGRFRVKKASPLGSHKREDFLRDVKKVVRKLPPDHPSRSG